MKQNILRKIGLPLVLSFLLLSSGCGSSNTNDEATDTFSETTKVAEAQENVSANIANDSNISDTVTVFRANAGVDQTIVFESEFTFDGSKSTGDIVSYEWVFGENILNASDTATSTYTRLATQPAGVYTVTLKATDSSGQVSSDDVIITVINQMSTEISVEEFKVLMQTGVTYIDIREPFEWNGATGVIAGSHKITYENSDISPWLEDGSPFLNLIQNRNQEFVLICKGGPRAEAAANELLDAGYSKVHWLFGGINKWIAEGESTEK